MEDNMVQKIGVFMTYILLDNLALHRQIVPVNKCKIQITDSPLAGTFKNIRTQKQQFRCSKIFLRPVNFTLFNVSTLPGSDETMLHPLHIVGMRRMAISIIRQPFVNMLTYPLTVVSHDGRLMYSWTAASSSG